MCSNLLSQPKDTSRTYTLGVVNIISGKDSKSVTQSDNLKTNANDVSKALSAIPSVTFTNIGGKSETSVYVRGFDSKSVPIFIDGIPVYVPYDGALDLGRFKTYDYSRIDVSNGFSAMSYGSNTLGGAINLISTKPQKELELQAMTGFASGDEFSYGVSAGSKTNNSYVQGSFYGTHRNYFPLSKDFNSTSVENGANRENSYSSDRKYNLKLGYTPNETDEYSVNYINQHGEKGTPPYTGIDKLIKARFWQWPYWDKQSVYYISNTYLGFKSNVKVKAYYDEYKNQLKSYDDASYSTQKAKSTFTSCYDDNSFGTNLDFSTEYFATNFMNLSIHFKQDVHKEHNVGEPERKFVDNNFSVGFDDIYKLVENLNIIGGLGFNYKKSSEADDYNSTTKIISSFPANNHNSVDAQIGLQYILDQTTTVSTSFAYKTRFANMKDRYSYKLGTAIPNPDLKSENATHYEISISNKSVENLNIFFAAYYSKLNNTIQQVDNVQSKISQMQNTGESEFKGLEFSADYACLKILNAKVNYSYISRKNTSQEALKFTDVPEHQLAVYLTAKLLKDAELTINPEYNSERYSTSYGTKASEFTLLNVNTNYKWKFLTLYAGLNNIFDRNYAYTEGYPAQGRNFFVNLVYNF